MSGANYPNPVRLAEFVELENVVGVFADIINSEGDGALCRFARVFRTDIVEIVTGKCVSAMVRTKISNIISICGTFLS